MFFQAEDGIRDIGVTGVQTCALPISLLLVATVVLSVGATVGVAALLFDGVFGFPGSDPGILLIGFVFLVALGIDYNIFLMTRAREESQRHGAKAGVLRALAVTGGVITSAGGGGGPHPRSLRTENG